MAVGKSSLNRVAQKSVIAAAEPEVAAAVIPQTKDTEKKAPEKKAAAKKAAPATAVARKFYAVGDKLPVYLL